MIFFRSLLPFLHTPHVFERHMLRQIVLYSCALSREGEQYLEENCQGPWARDMGKRMNEVSEADKQSV
jgi:hypothetical protein